MMNLVDIPRNDPALAIKWAEERLDAGDFDRDDGEILVTLQDDPTSYFAAFAEAMAVRKAAGKTVPRGF